MKITNVTASHLPGTRYAWVFLHVDTDAGIRGLGQVSSGPHSALVAAEYDDGRAKRRLFADR